MQSWFGNGCVITCACLFPFAAQASLGGDPASVLRDQPLAQCASNSSAPGLHCRVVETALSPTVNGTKGTTGNFTLKLANANSLSNSFDFGLTFFFGRSIYAAFEQRATPGDAGPFIAVGGL